MARPSTSLPALAPHFHLPPAHTHPQSSAQSLERRLLGGEAGGKMRNGVAPTAAVDDLLVGENAPQEPLIPALNDLTHSRDQRQIHADAHDVHAQQDAIRPAVDRAAAVLLAPGPRMPHCCSCSTGRHSPGGGSRRHGPASANQKSACHRPIAAQIIPASSAAILSTRPCSSPSTMTRATGSVPE